MTRRAVAVACLAAAAGAATVVVMATRVGERARFVGWPVVAFTALAAVLFTAAAAVACRRPLLALVGIVPGFVLFYVSAVLPFPLVALEVGLFLGLVLATRHVVLGGVAATVATGLLALTVLPGPAAECTRTGSRASSGPWWEWSGSGDGASGSGSAMFHRVGADGGVLRGGGSTEVGGRTYVFRCEGGRLVDFSAWPG